VHRPAVDQALNTAQFPSGKVPLMLAATDAAKLTTTFPKTLLIDNTVPTVSMSGPTDAASTAGAQYVTASATGGPSGIEGPSCSVDSGPNQWFSGATARVPVAGVGGHTVSCGAAGNAVDPAGNHAVSSIASWSISIRQPTVSGIGFAHIADALVCHRVTERITVLGRWVTVRRNHRWVCVRTHGRSKIVTYTRC
jgi:hypothetical protein